MLQKREIKQASWSCSPVECDLGILLLFDCFLILASRYWRHDVVYELMFVYLKEDRKTE